MKYHIGDKLICRVNEDETIIFDMDWDDERYNKFKTKLFEVIGIFRDHYILLVPTTITSSSLLDKDTASSLEEMSEDESSNKLVFDPKHFGKHILLLREKSVGGREVYDPYDHPLQCLMCEEYFPWALPNQEDDSFICWVCRNTRVF